MECQNNEKTKGCVYFFKHIGLSPIKIGFSLRESPIIRFEQFKTYAPFGAEILGFIKTYEPVHLERLLHSKFSSFRIKGEWFEISEELALKTIDFYSNIEDVNERNEFQLAWAKKNSSLSIGKDKHLYTSFHKVFSVDKTKGEKIVINLKETISLLKAHTGLIFDKKIVKDIFKNLGVIYTTHRIDPYKSKKGYLVSLIV